jgi:hypothetical protein
MNESAENQTMFVNNQVNEIAQSLLSLPPEKIAAVKDYVDFLKSRYDKDGAVDESDEWTEEDLRDFAAASARYGETVAPWEDDEPHSTQGGPEGDG